MFSKIIIGVDPAVTNGANSDETGIVVVAKGEDGNAYVLEDLSMKGSPAVWGQRIVSAYHTYKAHCVVAEVNQGGDLVENLLKTLDPTLRFKAVRATKSKQARAAPVALLYEQGRVFHRKAFPILEEQMCNFIPGATKSPDRLDALVWGLAELMRSTRKSGAPSSWVV